MTAFRRGIVDLISMSTLHLEGLLGVILWHYGDLFRSSERLTGPFQAAISSMIPHRFWGVCAVVVGMLMVCLSIVALWSKWRCFAVRRFTCLGGFFLMGYLAYSCWKTDVPFDVSRVFYFYAFAHAVTGVLLHLRLRDDDDATNVSALAGEA